MAPRKLLILAGILAVLGLLAYVSSRPPGPRSEPGARPGDPLLPDLDVNAVTAIEVREADTTVRIEKGEHGWVNVDLFGYPADFDRLRSELITLSRLEVGQIVRGGEDLTGELGLSTNRTEIVLRDGSGESLAAIHLGVTRTRETGSPYGGMPDGHYLRVGDGPVVVVAETLSAWTAEASDWINKDLVQVVGTEIRRIRVEHAGEGYEVSFPGGGAGQMDGLAEGETLNAGNAGRLQRALSNLRCETVADPALTDADTGLDDPYRYVAEAANGLRYQVLTGRETDDGRYARISGTFEKPPAPTRREAEASIPGDVEDREAAVEAELERLEAEHAERLAAAKARLDELARLASWTFVIPAYSANSLRLERGDLVNPPPEPQPEPAESGDPADGNPTGDSGTPASPVPEPAHTAPAPVSDGNSAGSSQTDSD